MICPMEGEGAAMVLDQGDFDVELLNMRGVGGLCLCMNASARKKAGPREIILEGLGVLKEAFFKLKVTAAS
jgi:hypothetical protein